MSIYLVEIYELGEEKKRSYRILMSRIHRSLRDHANDIPELRSYRTFEAHTDGSRTMFVEVFEFSDKRSHDRFFDRFPKTDWLLSLQQEFFKIVNRSKMKIFTWTGFLKDEWFVR